MNQFSRKRKRPKKEKKEYPKLSAQERMNICVSCEKYLKATKRCAKCGCFLAIKTKLPMFHCPLDKW